MDINKEYQTKLDSTFFTNFTANQRRVIVVSGAFVVESTRWQNTTPVKYRRQRINDVRTIEIFSDDSVVHIILHDPNDEIIYEQHGEPLLNPTYWSLLLCYKVEEITGDDEYVEFDTYTRESLMGATAIAIASSGTQYWYKDVSHMSGVINLTDSVIGTRIDANASIGSTLYGGNIDIYVDFGTQEYSVNNKIKLNDTFILDGDFGIIRFPFVIPLATSLTYPHVVLNVTGVPKTQYGVNANTLTLYSVNGETDGEVESVLYGSDTSELVLKGVGYYFTQDSIDYILNEMISPILYESVDSSLDEYGQIHFVFHRIKGTIEFEPSNISDLKMKANPTLTKNLTGISTSDESSFGLGEPYNITLTATGTHKMITYEDIEVIMNGIDVSSQCVFIVNGIARILIQVVNGDVVINATTSDEWSITITRLLVSETFYSPNKKNNVRFNVESDDLTKFIFNSQESSVMQIPLQEDEEIIGLGLNTTSYIISKNKNVVLDISKFTDTRSITLYIVKKTSVVPTGFQMNVYQLDGEKNVVDKTDVITSVDVLTGTLRDSCSVVSPIITIEQSDLPDFNYVYIPNFNRYYFVREITSHRTGLWILSLQCDVLMSFADTIKSQVGIVARNEFDFNNMIEDNQRLIEKDEEYTRTNISTSSELKKDGYDQTYYILQLVG